jgi:hypothetical protein
VIIHVTYIALQWDNHQGGQGRTFENKLLIDINQFEQLHKAYEIAEREIEKAVNLVQFGQANQYGFKIISIELVKPISAQQDEVGN